jgi:hypothetical protein
MTGYEAIKKIKLATYGIERFDDDMKIHIDVMEDGREAITVKMVGKRDRNGKTR